MPRWIFLLECKEGRVVSLKIVLKSLFSILATMLIVSAFVFFAEEMSIGDSASYILSDEASEKDIEEYRKQNGLDDNIAIRYFNFLLSFFSLEWGSDISGHSIISVIAERLPVTLSLSFFSILMSLSISFVWVLFSVLKRGSFADLSLSVISIILLSIPSFLIAIGLSLFFGLFLRWFPVAGYIAPEYSITGFFKTLFLPSSALALVNLPLFMRMFRQSLLSNLDKIYTLSFKAQGANRLDLILHSALKPSLPLIFSLVVQSISTSISGSAVIENVFALPGLGALLVKSVLSRDARLAGTILMVVSFFISILALLANMLSLIVDPRLREER